MAQDSTQPCKKLKVYICICKSKINPIAEPWSFNETTNSHSHVNKLNAIILFKYSKWNHFKYPGPLTHVAS